MFGCFAGSFLGGKSGVGRDHVAGLDKRDVFRTLGDLSAAVVNEFIHIALVIGEQYEALKMLGRCRRVVGETNQG